MSTTNSPAEEQNPVEATSQSQNPSAPESPASEPVLIPGFLPPERVLEQLSAVRDTQPVAAIATANQHRAVLTEAFLKAVEEGVADPVQDFAKHGMLFNYAGYFLAKWRERAAYPLFLRWFSLPGEEALELGGDTVAQHGARFLASVCGGDVEPLKNLVLNREANRVCRAQAMKALGVLSAWGELPREDVENWFLFLSREGLEREKGPIWLDLAQVCIQLEFLAAFPELRRAREEGLIDPEIMHMEDLETVEKMPRGNLLKMFAETNPPITNVVEETRWWAGFQRNRAPEPAREESAGPAGIVSTGVPYVAPPKVGRNDPCPCGSGKKFKKCHGQ